MNIPSLADLRKDDLLRLIDELRAEADRLAVRAFLLKERVRDLFFRLQRADDEAREGPAADPRGRTQARILTAWLLAVFVLDIVLMGPSIEFLVAWLTENVLLRWAVTAALAAAVLGVDIGLGTRIAKPRGMEQKSEFRLVLLVAACAWTLVVPLLVLATATAARNGEEALAFGLLRAALLVISWASHGGLIFSGSYVDDALTVRAHVRERAKTENKLQMAREGYYELANEALVRHDACGRQIAEFGKRYPGEQQPLITFNAATLQLLAERANGAGTATDADANTPPALR